MDETREACDESRAEGRAKLDRLDREHAAIEAAGAEGSPARRRDDRPPGPIPPHPERRLGGPDRREDRPDRKARRGGELLDRLTGLVGELARARDLLFRHSNLGLDPELARASRRLDRATSALRDAMTRARLRPIGESWESLSRLVLDLALAGGKSVRFTQEGAATEIDRAVAGAIQGPITHLIRHAVEHGIELPGDRLAAGKPESGRLTLRASHRGPVVLVEVEDDGAGIDPGSAARLGLDVVRSHVEVIGGTIEIRNRPGLGTTMAIGIPPNPDIIASVVALDGRGEPHAIPRHALVERVRLDEGAIAREVESIGGAAFYRLRGELLPLVDLDGVLGEVSLDPRGRPSLDVAVLRADGRRFGLVAESIVDTGRVAVEPPGPTTERVPHRARATLLADGRLARILDVPGIARSAGLGAGPADLDEAGPSPRGPGSRAAKAGGKPTKEFADRPLMSPEGGPDRIPGRSR